MSEFKFIAFPESIKVQELYVEKMEECTLRKLASGEICHNSAGEVEFDVVTTTYSIRFDGDDGGVLWLVDNIRTEEEAKNLIPAVAEYYNKIVYKENPYLRDLYGVYLNHVKKFNEKGWTKRLDFTTEDTYAAFIKGLQFSVMTILRCAMTDGLYLT